MEFAFHLPTALLGGALSYGLLALVLLYLSRLPDATGAERWWSAAYAADTARLGMMLALPLLGATWSAFLAESLQAVFALLLLGGTCRFIGYRSHGPLLVAAAAVATAWSASFSFAWPDFMARVLPLYALSAAVHGLTGWALWRSAGRGGATAQRAVALLFVLWALHKLDYPWLYPVDRIAPWGFLLAQALALSVALGLIITAQRRHLLAADHAVKRALSAQEHLQASEQRMRAMVDCSPIPFVITEESEGRYLYVNAAMAQMMGLPAERLVGRRAVEFYADARDRETMLRALERNGYVDDLEVTVCRADGTELPVSLSVRRFHWQGEQALLAGFHDLTQRRRAENEVRRSHERLRTVLANAPVMVHALDARGVFTLSEGRELRTVGVDPHLLVGRSAFDVLQQPAHVAAIRRVLGGEAFSGITEIGEYRYHSHFQPIVEGDGSVAGAVVVSTNVTRYTQAEAERTRLAAVVQQTADNIIITDTSGHIQYVNPAFERTSGYSRSEAIGKTPRLLKSDTVEPLVYRSLWETLANGKVWSGRLTNRRKDGSLYDVEATISALRDAEGRVVSYIAVQKDVTEQVQLEAQLRQSQRMELIGNLAGSIAHDFNNLLMPIIGYAELLGADDDLQAESRQDVEHISSAAYRARELINQVLVFSRRREGDLQAIQVETMVAEALHLIRMTAPPSVRLSRQVDPNAVVLGDPTLLHQVLMNLCVNALQAMSEGGTLTVQAAAVDLVPEQEDVAGVRFGGRHVRLTVADTGEGMEDATRAHIFEPFFSTKADRHGTGLGLSTVLRIVEQHGGHVTVTSAPGHGATFNVYLPAAETDAAEESAPQAPAQGGQEAILYVDDEPAIAAMAERALKRQGYAVTALTSPTRALEMLRESPGAFDLLITDQSMPEASGLQLVRQVRALHMEIPVALCSGYSDGIDLAEVKDLGVSEVLQKPLGPEALGQHVRRILDRSAGDRPPAGEPVDHRYGTGTG